jgi:proton glutamate symport protein
MNARGVPLYLQIVAAMALGLVVGLGFNLGAEAGFVEREVALVAAGVGERIGRLFLALLSMIVVPLIATSLVASIVRVGSGAAIGRLGLRTALWYVSTSLVAIGTGLLFVNLIRPGEGLELSVLLQTATGELATTGRAAPDVTPPSGGWLALVDVIYRAVPSNVVAAASDNKSILAVIFFALLVGVFTVRAGEEHRARLGPLYESAYEVMLTMTRAVLVLTPLGVFGYVVYVTAGTGLSVVGALGWYMLTVALGLAIHSLFTLPFLLYVLGGRSPSAYARAILEALMTAFSTASSSGTLPVTLRSVEAAGVSKRVSSFTLPLGATVNMDGTALFEVVAVLFVAQMQGGLGLGQQVVVALTALLASIGAAGIPHAGTVMLVVVLGAVGLPTDAVLVLFAVDRILDMGRTTVNVWSDSVGAAVIDRWESGTTGVQGPNSGRNE